MHVHQKIDGEEDRTPYGTNRVIYGQFVVKVEEVVNRKSGSGMVGFGSRKRPTHVIRGYEVFPG